MAKFTAHHAENLYKLNSIGWYLTCFRNQYYKLILTSNKQPMAVMHSWQHITYKPSKLGQSDLVF